MPMSRLQRKFAHQDRSIEWMCSLLMMAWAICLAMPGDTLSLAAFKGFLKYGMTETAWALLFGVVAAFRMAALRINGRWPRSATIRQIGAVIGSFAWFQVSMLIFCEKKPDFPWTPLMFLSVVVAGYELFSLLRARFDERYYNR